MSFNKALIMCCSFFISLHSMDYQLTTQYGYSLRENGKGWIDKKNGSRIVRQEDTIKCKNNKGFFALFDGHGGPLVSYWLRDNFFPIFQKTKSHSASEKLQEAFSKADSTLPPTNDAQEKYYDESGSTAVITYLNKCENGTYNLTVAHTGDSRAVLEKNGSVDFETEDHNCKNAKERERVKNLGGTITTGSSGIRVNGIEVTRAIGDKAFRENVIIPIPEITEVNLTTDHTLLILASDGVWNKITSQEAITIVNNAINLSKEELQKNYPKESLITHGQLKGKTDIIEEDEKNKADQHLTLAARALCHEAIKLNSTDNYRRLL